MLCPMFGELRGSDVEVFGCGRAGCPPILPYLAIGEDPENGSYTLASEALKVGVLTTL